MLKLYHKNQRVSSLTQPYAGGAFGFVRNNLRRRYNGAMVNDRRRFWSTLIFIGLFAPFLIMVILSLAMPSPMHSGAASGTAPALASGGGGGAPASGNGGTTATAASPAKPQEEVFVAGDQRDLWVVTPTPQPNDQAFDLYHRESNNGVWSKSTRKWPGTPHALALMLPVHPNVDNRSTPYVISRSGGVDRYSLEDSEGATNIPAGQIVRAFAGAPDSLFVMTLGPKPVAASRPVDLAPEPVESATTAPTTALSPATTAVSVAATTPNAPTSMPALVAPATLAAAPGTVPAPPAGPQEFNIFWYPPHGSESLGLKLSEWSPLPSLGEPSADGRTVPTASSLVTLAVQGDRLIALWIDPVHSENLMVRTLEYRSQGAAWSAPVATVLPLKDRGAVRLFAVSLDQNIYALWTVSLNNVISLHGGRLAAANASDSTAPALFTIPAKNLFPNSVPVGPADGISPADDVALGTSENSFVAVALNKERVPVSLTFDDRGRVLSPAAAIEPHTAQRDLQIGQNIATILLMLMFTLSLWQWRQKPVTPALPTDMMIAPIHLRAVAFLIDAVIPYAIVLTTFGLWDGSPLAPLFSWFSLLNQPQEAFRSAPLLVFVGLYFVHVSLGELFFRRSVGKAIVGLQVLMLDGKAPTLAAIVIRNLVRIPETIVGLVLLYMLISERHQRLGDLLARTLVVAQQPPETPPDPDK